MNFYCNYLVYLQEEIFLILRLSANGIKVIAIIDIVSQRKTPLPVLSIIIPAEIGAIIALKPKH